MNDDRLTYKGQQRGQFVTFRPDTRWITALRDNDKRRHKGVPLEVVSV